MLPPNLELLMFYFSLGSRILKLTSKDAGQNHPTLTSVRKRKTKKKFQFHSGATSRQINNLGYTDM